MADASRFPHLALPFAIIGAAAGWLSAGLVQHPLLSESDSNIRLATALVSAGAGALIGALLRRWCSGKQYAWQLDAPDPRVPPASDSWARHGTIILSGGAAAGAFFAVASGFCTIVMGILAGILCTLPFLLVCAVVLRAARRAQRARTGSLISGSDRRAIWSILSVSLAITTLLALPDWPAPHAKPLFGPEPALGLLILAGASILGVLGADVLAWLRVKRMLSLALAPRQAGDPGLLGEKTMRLDIGLGDELHAHVARPGAVYRGRDRTLALVQGDLGQALQVLRRAIRRGLAGLLVFCAVSAAHDAATTDAALVEYEKIRCRYGKAESCSAVVYSGADGGDLGASGVKDAVRLYERGCDSANGLDCLLLATYYRGGETVERDPALVALFEYRAAQRGLCPEGTRLVRGAENVCVAPNDPRW